MADAPKLNAVGVPEPEPGQPVPPHDRGGVEGLRQDGPGAAPPRPERTDATPIGSTAARRGGPSAAPDGGEPGRSERGKPAPFTQGEARGSGSSAGGGGTGVSEDISADPMAGGGRPAGPTGARPLPGEQGSR